MLSGYIEILGAFVYCFSNWDRNGLFVAIALIGAFAFSATSFHQFSILFQPSLLSSIFIFIELFFQFSTFSVTFYYGLNKFFDFHSSDVLVDKLHKAIPSQDIECADSYLSTGTKSKNKNNEEELSPDSVTQEVKWD